MSRASELHDAIAGLERRRSTATRELADVRSDVAAFRKKLELLDGGFFGRGGRRWPTVVLIGVLLGGGGLGHHIYTSRQAMHGIRKMTLATPAPQVLVTSVPSGAEVTVNGARVGRSPILWRAETRGGPAAGRAAATDVPARNPVVTVRAAGYHKATRSVSISAGAGAHWHAVLKPELTGSEKTPKPRSE